MNHITCRPATENDIPLILHFIKGLAEYENMSDDVVATEELLGEWLFDKKTAEVLLAVKDGKEVGFALFFHNFSTFLGRAGIYIEDVYVEPEHRGCGCGKMLFREIARIAEKRGCGRVEWSCLDWNQPSIDFYLSMHARPMSEWTVYRLTQDEIHALAQG